MAEARQRLAELLDTAERGQAVMIERRGVRFVVEAQRPPPSASEIDDRLDGPGHRGRSVDVELGA